MKSIKERLQEFEKGFSKDYVNIEFYDRNQIECIVNEEYDDIISTFAEAIVQYDKNEEAIEFLREHNNDFMHDTIDNIEILVEEKYEELKLSDDYSDRDFYNAFKKSEVADDDEQTYINFVNIISNNKEAVNVWHIEQNALKKSYERESIKDICLNYYTSSAPHREDKRP